ncbi:hypothetical protein BC628DRAFT_772710 [Trametes gibbosa]|nr:hypothetical protein BC628DRAFT_772710 [Trametes gibbosa]
MAAVGRGPASALTYTSPQTPRAHGEVHGCRREQRRKALPLRVLRAPLSAVGSHRYSRELRAHTSKASVHVHIMESAALTARFARVCSQTGSRPRTSTGCLSPRRAGWGAQLHGRRTGAGRTCVHTHLPFGDASQPRSRSGDTILLNGSRAASQTALTCMLPSHVYSSRAVLEYPVSVESWMVINDADIKTGWLPEAPQPASSTSERHRPRAMWINI